MQLKKVHGRWQTHLPADSIRSSVLLSLYHSMICDDDAVELCALDCIVCLCVSDMYSICNINAYTQQSHCVVYAERERVSLMIDVLWHKHTENRLAALCLCIYTPASDR